MYTSLYNKQRETAIIFKILQVRKAEDGSVLRTVKGPDSQNIPAMSLHFHPQRKDVFYAASACGNIFMCSDQKDRHETFAHGTTNTCKN